MLTAVPAPKLNVPVPWWYTAVSWAAIVGAVVMVALVVRHRWRRRRHPKAITSEARQRRWVQWVANRWPWDAQNLGLVLVDETTRHRYDWWTGRTRPPAISYPRAEFQAAPGGLTAWLHTLPGVGLDQVSKVATHLADAWGCIRVDVSQAGPGLLHLRGFVTDPLAQPWQVTPDGQPLADWLLHVGIGDEGDQIRLPLANLSGVTVAGIPGTGKTSLQRWWLSQLAPHPAVQVVVLDGKVSDPGDGDYGELLGRCVAATGDDLKEANDVLERLWRTMRDRSSWLRANRGVAQFWEHGPTPDCPLVLVVIDESHTFVTAATKADREWCEANTWFMTKLAKEGRSRGFLTVFITQKQTADAIPTAVRDVCQVGISFGVRTMDGAVAALGDEIRQYPEIAPTSLVGRQWAGVAVMRHPDRPGYHRVRTPYVSEQDAAKVLQGSSQLTRRRLLDGHDGDDEVAS